MSMIYIAPYREGNALRKIFELKTDDYTVDAQGQIQIKCTKEYGSRIEVWIGLAKMTYISNLTKKDFYVNQQGRISSKKFKDIMQQKQLWKKNPLWIKSHA